jgi:hypothetical protein
VNIVKMNEEKVGKTYLSVVMDAQKVFGMCAQALANTPEGKDAVVNFRLGQPDVDKVTENTPDYKSSLGAAWINDSKFE